LLRIILVNTVQVMPVMAAAMRCAPATTMFSAGAGALYKRCTCRQAEVDLCMHAARMCHPLSADPRRSKRDRGDSGPLQGRSLQLSRPMLECRPAVHARTHHAGAVALVLPAQCWRAIHLARRLALA
jgi:hypothetical protein